MIIKSLLIFDSLIESCISRDIRHFLNKSKEIDFQTDFVDQKAFICFFCRTIDKINSPSSVLTLKIEDDTWKSHPESVAYNFYDGYYKYPRITVNIAFLDDQLFLGMPAF